jgi:hypothetical protein
LFTDRDSLRKSVEKWRTLFPFLKSWCFVGGHQVWGRSATNFENIDNTGIEEYGEEHLLEREHGYQVKVHVGAERFSVEKRLPPLAGGYSGAVPYAISPINGLYLSEFSLHYLAMFLLSSLVRYRPQTWVHAVSRSSVSDAPADDQALALLEHFLSVNSEAIPSLIVTALNPHEDRYT